jgi:hypothetical protein
MSPEAETRYSAEVLSVAKGIVAENKRSYRD